jgi:two-component system, NarL family, invasion response regulator UvrY
MKFLLVDDHPIMRVGVRHLVQTTWQDAEVAEASSLADACHQVATFTPEIIVLDVGLPDASGPESIVRMRKVAPDTPILVLSFNEEAACAVRALKLGANGYVSKDQVGGALVTALQSVLQGKRYLAPSVTDQLLDLAEADDAGTGAAHEALAPQEFRVMVMIAAGRTPAEMSKIMHLSLSTIATYRARVLQKIGVKSNVELAKYCMLHKLPGAA